MPPTSWFWPSPAPTTRFTVPHQTVASPKVAIVPLLFPLLVLILTVCSFASAGLGKHESKLRLDGYKPLKHRLTWTLTCSGKLAGSSSSQIYLGLTLTPSTFGLDLASSQIKRCTAHMATSRNAPCPGGGAWCLAGGTVDVGSSPRARDLNWTSS